MNGQTTDGGVSWDTTFLQTGNIDGLAHNGHGAFIGVGGAPPGIGVMYRSVGGEKWVRVVSNLDLPYLPNVVFADSATAYVIGVGAFVAKSDNAGITWNPLHDDDARLGFRERRNTLADRGRRDVVAAHRACASRA